MLGVQAVLLMDTRWDDLVIKMLQLLMFEENDHDILSVMQHNHSMIAWCHMLILEKDYWMMLMMILVMDGKGIAAAAALCCIVYFGIVKVD